MPRDQDEDVHVGEVFKGANYLSLAMRLRPPSLFTALSARLLLQCPARWSLPTA
jgi:hypothetical protein